LCIREATCEAFFSSPEYATALRKNANDPPPTGSLKSR
jgi:hypothetical protein